MADTLQISLAQTNVHVGDIAGNAERIALTAANATQDGADLVVFTELSVTGYPPEDLLLRPSLQTRVNEALKVIAAASHDIAIAIGYPLQTEDGLFNCAGIWHGGECIAEYRKQKLPNYQVFDEKRYFSAGHQPCVVDYRGVKLGLTVCEDIWFDEPVAQAAGQGADLILNLNASPFHMGKHEERIALVQRHVESHGVPILYTNQVGGQDELVFDGSSFAVAGNGETVLQLPSWEEASGQVKFENGQLKAISASAPARSDELADL